MSNPHPKMWSPKPPPHTPLSAPHDPSLISPTTDKSTPLFPPALLPASVLSALPQNYTMRPLQHSDFHNGMLDVLRVLTTVGEIGEEAWGERYEWMSRRGDEYFVLVVADGGGRVVGTGCVFVERKFIHNLGLVGHIEDIVVNKDQQGKKLGLRIIEALDHIAAKVGCYKTILDCSETNEGFYVKCGYKRVGLEMAHYHEGKNDRKL